MEDKLIRKLYIFNNILKQNYIYIYYTLFFLPHELMNYIYYNIL